jgi:small subunit ribosomal protein S1
MARLLEQSPSFKELRRGDLVAGEIMRVGQDGLLVNVGHKSEGFVPLREMSTVTPDEMANFQIGDEVYVSVLRSDSEEHSAMLSIDKARGEQGWKVLQDHLESGTFVNGTVRAFNKGGAVVDVEGIQGFVPLSQLAPNSRASELKQEDVLAQRVGETIKLQLLELDRQRNRVVLSERQALQYSRDQEKDRLLKELNEGEVRKGVVSGVSAFGAFVDLGGADGLIHISEMSWDQVRSPSDLVTVGSEIEVYVLKVDQETRKIALSLRRLSPEPWQTAAETYSIGQIVEAVVTRLTDFGAFARIQGNIEGLIHISELAHQVIRHPKEVVSEGDTVSLKIINIEPERRRLGLSLKQVEGVLLEGDSWSFGE